MTKKCVLILGGAGFIGSHISKKFVEEGYKVTIIDGLFERTGGHSRNIKDILNDVTFIKDKIENVKSLGDIIKTSDLIVDCMGWTAHRLAIENPHYDLCLNVASHLWFLEVLRNYKDKCVIYLGSRGQYGNPKTSNITEKINMEPLDIQGIHKMTAEAHYRVFSNLFQIRTVSLRLGACFGPNQPLHGSDIGLVGSFIRDSLQGREISLYGNTRKRYIIFVSDVANIVFNLADEVKEDFLAYNLVGKSVYIEEIAKKILEITGQGSYKVETIPEHIKKIDMGDTKVSSRKLKSRLGQIYLTNFDFALRETIDYFKDNLHD